MNDLYFPRPPIGTIDINVDSISAGAVSVTTFPLYSVIVNGPSGLTTLSPGAGGQVLVSQGVSALPTIRALLASDLPTNVPTQQILAGSGTYVTPTNCKYIIVQLVGGGAGGASSSSINRSGGGGGAGAYCRAVLPAGSYLYSVGSAGAGATANAAVSATNGTDTTFGSLTAGGGLAGLNGAGVNNGSGGQGGAFTGGPGFFGAPGGGGGAGFGDVNGVGGGNFLCPQTRGLVNSADVVGDNAVTYGGGGASAVHKAAGGNGGIGAIQINEFYSYLLL